ncbi:MAG: OsmC family protein [Chitinophagaceae bacterium]
MTSKIIYRGDLRTEMVHEQSKSVVETDAPKDNHGKGERFSPTDLVATALGSCMFSIMGIAARTHHIDIEGAVAEVEKIMISDPQRRIGEIIISIYMPEKNYSEKEKKILIHAAMTCPVFLSLNEQVIKTVRWHWKA